MSFNSICLGALLLDWYLLLNCPHRSSVIYTSNAVLPSQTFFYLFYKNL